MFMIADYFYTQNTLNMILIFPRKNDRMISIKLSMDIHLDITCYELLFAALSSYATVIQVISGCGNKYQCLNPWRTDFYATIETVSILTYGKLNIRASHITKSRVASDLTTQDASGCAANLLTNVSWTVLTSALEDGNTFWKTLTTTLLYVIVGQIQWNIQWNLSITTT